MSFKKPKLYIQNDYDTDIHSMESGLSCPEPTLTQQNTAEQTDINYIVQQFTQTGVMPQPIKLPTYGDFTSVVTDYQSALELVQEATDAFNSLPSAARAHFDNNPAYFLNYMENAPDPHLLAKLGLADLIELEPKNPDSSGTVILT